MVRLHPGAQGGGRADTEAIGGAGVVCVGLGGGVEDTVNTWIAVAGIAGSIVAYSAGSIVSGWFNRLNNRDQMEHAERMADVQRRHAEHMAVFEKRLEAHQEIYSKSHSMAKEVLYPAGGFMTTAAEGVARAAYEELKGALLARRLYLGKDVGRGVLKLLKSTNQYLLLNEEVSEDVIREHMTVVVQAILKETDLPAVEQEESIHD